ncbi:MAG: hypothetical protein ACE37F_08735 [Nannocystaceae bacterium]|nr:hypothetical protein [bacterium]
MTLRSAALVGLAAFALGCAGASEHVLAFDPGEHAASVQAVRVDVVQARYAERQLTVLCTVGNDGDTPLTVTRAGVLLDDDGLEIPPAALAGQPAQVSIAPGDAISLQFAFPVGGWEPRARTLGFWVLGRDGRDLPPVRVSVPGIREEPA